MASDANRLTYPLLWLSHAPMQQPGCYNLFFPPPYFILENTLRLTQIDQGRVFATLTRNMFGLQSLVKRFRNGSFVNNLLKHDGMIARIQADIYH